jgi:hypothetical protein
VSGKRGAERSKKGEVRRPASFRILAFLAIFCGDFCFLFLLRFLCFFAAINEFVPTVG